MAAKQSKLTREQQTFVVQSLACFDSLATVVAAVRKEFKVDITPQSIEGYDPTKRAGRNLSKLWRGIFETTREEFLKNSAAIGVSHKSVRLRAIQRMAEKAESQGNLALASQLLEQAAKEMGDSYTNRHKLEHTGANGGPMQVQRIERVIVKPGSNDRPADQDA